MRQDNQAIAITHLTQLLDVVTGFGGFIVPLILWLVQRDRIISMDLHGKAIMKFQISMFAHKKRLRFELFVVEFNHECWMKVRF